jgi:hypothetical protein
MACLVFRRVRLGTISTINGTNMSLHTTRQPGSTANEYSLNLGRPSKNASVAIQIAKTVESDTRFAGGHPGLLNNDGHSDDKVDAPFNQV